MPETLSEPMSRAAGSNDLAHSPLRDGVAETTVVAKLSRELAKIEKRDWELWMVVLVTGVAVSAGLLVLTFPAAFLSTNQQQLHFELNVSKELFLGLVALLVLFNTYLVSKRLELRRTRERLITTTIQAEMMRMQSFLDPLTEVYNRRSLQETAARYISHARRSKKPLTFLLADADRFKEINDNYGHLTGDLVIAEIAALLRSSVRGCDAVVRYGGDEFLMVLADTNKKGAETVVNRIHRSVLAWNDACHLKDVKLSVSIGVAEWKDNSTLDQILNDADREMYRSKNHKK